ncbi:interleukin-15 isoform X1 [Paramisgurnus dabryanus]|uniref:interleukin-15 isoform X1 n=1 Tax=Paramisgurnus dabryanus TaxID=90735 RepID=UPI003CCF9F67
MILVTLLLAIIIGVRNKPTKQKTMRSGRCACNHWCFENHLECPLNSEVWNSFLILSCLSALLPVADSQRVQELKDLQNALEKTEYLFNRSSAILYTPNPDSINECTYKFLDCYLLEMNVVVHEEGTAEQVNENDFLLLKNVVEYRKHNHTAPHLCETQELTDSPVFYQRMKTFLQKLTTHCRQKGPNKSLKSN